MRLSLLLAFLPIYLAAQSNPLDDADAAIKARQPWRATEILTPVLAIPVTRTPEALITAARAAEGWRGWATVRSLLMRETWLDTKFDRMGRRLLAEADLGEGQLQQALINAGAAMPTGDGRRERNEQGQRFLVLARAQDRLDMVDSAATNYLRAAGLLPDVADWLLLRAAGVTRDSTDRADLYRRVILSAAKPRIPWTEAVALDRLDMYDASAARYDRLGADITAWSVRLKGATTDAAKGAIARALVGTLTPTQSITEARDAIDLLASFTAPLTREQQLIVARRAAVVTRPQQAADYFGSAAKLGALDARDRFSYGTVLGTLNRWPEAVTQFKGITDPSLAGPAAYQHARAVLRTGNEAGSIAALQAVIRTYPNDSVAAATALYLLGDLAIDAGRPDSARTLFLHLTHRFPNSTFRSRALIEAAIIALESGDAVQAAAELNFGLENNPPSGLEQDGYRYWLARAQMVIGDSVVARATFRALLSKGPENYYALQAAMRLDTLPWSAPPALNATIPAALQPAFNRAALLESLGMDVEARMELDRIASEAVGAVAMVQTALAFSAAGYPARAQQMAVRAQAGGAPKDGALWRLLYPLPYVEALRENAKHEGVDPFMAASVIRQESGFDPRAVSRTDARGLMQVMPAVGKALASGTPAAADFDVAMLFIPDVNLAFGMQHFSEAMKRYPEIERALAAYNAGQSRVDSWSQTLLGGARPTTDSVGVKLKDVEMFIERIPYTETRDYVRNIMRNVSVYRMLYGGVP